MEVGVTRIFLWLCRRLLEKRGFSVAELLFRPCFFSCGGGVVGSSAAEAELSVWEGSTASCGTGGSSSADPLVFIGTDGSSLVAVELLLR